MAYCLAAAGSCHASLHRLRKAGMQGLHEKSCTLPCFPGPGWPGPSQPQEASHKRPVDVASRPHAGHSRSTEHPPAHPGLHTMGDSWRPPESPRPLPIQGCAQLPCTAAIHLQAWDGVLVPAAAAQAAAQPGAGPGSVGVAPQALQAQLPSRLLRHQGQHAPPCTAIRAAKRGWSTVSRQDLNAGEFRLKGTRPEPPVSAGCEGVQHRACCAGLATHGHLPHHWGVRG